MTTPTGTVEVSTRNKVLESSIKRLKQINLKLLEKARTSSSRKEANEARKIIAKNKSLILDYEFRLQDDT